MKNNKPHELEAGYPYYGDFVSTYKKKFSRYPLRVHFATLSHKTLAWMIDGFVLSGLLYLTQLHWSLWLAMALVYFTLMESSRLQASLGEYILGIQVRHRTGRPARLRHILWRNVTYVFTLGLCSLSSFFSRKRCGLHDQIAHTISLEMASKKKS